MERVFEVLEQQSDINLILLDLGLLHIPGMDAIAELRARSTHASVRLLQQLSALTV